MKTPKEILEGMVGLEFCFGHKERTGQWITNNICNDCGLPIAKKKQDYIDQALADLAQIEESERLTEEEIEKIMIDFWSDKHPQPCFMDMEKITELARAITQAQVKKGKG